MLQFVNESLKKRQGFITLYSIYHLRETGFPKAFCGQKSSVCIPIIFVFLLFMKQN